MTLLEEIKKELKSILVELSYLETNTEINTENNTGNKEEINFDVSFIDQANLKYGDVSTNLAMILAKNTGKNLKEIAEEVASFIRAQKNTESFFSNILEDVSVAPNGFINFFLKEEFLVRDLERVSDLEFIDTKFTNKKVLLEHSSPNLFKPFHIGHLMNNIIGESLAKMMKATRSDLRIMSFPSDISIGIAKAIYVLKNKKNWSFYNEDIIQKLGEAYVEGVKIYEENIDKQEEIKAIAKNLFERNSETEDYQLFEKARNVNIEYFEKVMNLLGTKFDHLIYESQAGIRGEEIVKANLNKELGKEIFEFGENGAVVFDTGKRKNKEGEETIKSVFINSEGNPTYEAKDLGLLDLKYSYFPFDYNFFVTDNEQTDHFEVVLSAASKLAGNWPKISEKSRHIPHGRLNLKGERMSSRLGNILTVEETLKIVNDKALERISEKSGNLNEFEKENLIKNISLSALKIAILKSRPGLNIDFDFETSLNFEGATGPYLLYTYARANSLLEKSLDIDLENYNLEKVSENSISLIKKIIQFEEVAKNGIEELAPQAIVKYLFELAQAFNTFYAKEKIISEDIEKTKQNLLLVLNFKKVFKFALNMIGIEEVEKM